ncbi:MAG TPA: DUF5011 domain-containing protein [Tenericutes bacterium]|nr:DUF5011 domain-containing protein [Mycoplasmatota bacterium]
MSKLKNRRLSQIRNLIAMSALSALVLIVSAYAWFIGMQSVHVTNFEIEIAVAEELFLSLDGENWTTNLSISREDVEGTEQGKPYPNHTNSWGGAGLIPMSSVGEIDLQASRLKLYEKASFTASPGGWRILTSRVQNYYDEEEVLASEQDGYVAFDLFIKNLSGSEYYTESDVRNEEAIYLTIDSEVTVASAGVAGTGIENSVRVAFAQIGRVKADSTDYATIQGITCNLDEEGNPSYSESNKVTGICRKAVIWEPNDTSHTAEAISWYNLTCRPRIGFDVTLDTSFNKEGKCNPVVDGLAYPTYVVRDVINVEDNADAFDGLAYNTWDVAKTTVQVPDPENPGETITKNITPKLEETKYFTDTDKLKRGTERPAFMTLAPNSITKVRVYIWNEGQDVDNYDFASIGKRISVKFGFTKQQLTEGDIGYEGPNPNEGYGPGAEDKTPPIIVLNPDSEGNTDMMIPLGSEFNDPGVEEAYDVTGHDAEGNPIKLNYNVEGDDSDVKISGVVNTNHPGTYRITYEVRDAKGNLARIMRRVTVYDPNQE